MTPVELLFIIPDLGGGGAERACVNLLKEIDRTRFAPHLALFRRDGVLLSETPDDVPIHDLQCGSRDPRVIWRLGQLIDELGPRVVLSVMRYTNIITALAAIGASTSPRLIFNEQNRIQDEFSLYGGGWLKSRALRKLYPRADAIVAIADGIRMELVDDFGISPERVHVIHNPLDIARIQRLGNEPVEHLWFAEDVPVVVAVGRLHPQKGYDHLLRSFKLVTAQRPARLLILGEGPQRADLALQIAELGLAECVQLLGFQENPHRFVARASVFALSSIYEGFGYVVVEALALGTPVVATRCPTGPAEILRDGEFGLMVDVGDDAGLTEAILRVLDDHELANRLAERGRQRAQDFDSAAIADQYQTLFESLCAS